MKELQKRVFILELGMVMNRINRIKMFMVNVKLLEHLKLFKPSAVPLLISVKCTMPKRSQRPDETVSLILQ
jgi:hypothetical protein